MLNLQSNATVFFPFKFNYFNYLILFQAEMRKLKKFADKVFKKEVNEEWKVREERRKKKKRFNKKETEENKTEEGKKTEEGNNEQVTKKKRGKKRKLSDSENI